MSQATITREVVLTVDRASLLSKLAQSRQISEDKLIEKALDIFFIVTNLVESPVERQIWHQLSEPSLNRLWDNEQDAVYDNWREMYNVPEG